MSTFKRAASASGGWELPISEHELSRLTRELDEAHQETVPVMRASAADLSEQLRARAADEPTAFGSQRPTASRRRFLFGAGGAAAALALAACSSGSGKRSSAAPSSGAAPSAGDGSVYTGDLKIVALATALENQAIDAYTTALNAAKAGKLGKVPPAVAAFATAARSQHTDHAKAWNAVLTGAGKPPVDDIPLSNQAQVRKQLGSVTDVGGVAELALQLEDQAAQTYLFATFHVSSPAGISTAASIAPVEAMHAAILHFVLGQYPVPDDFLPVDKAASPNSLTV